MQVISQEVGAGISTVAIEYTKETALRPVFDILFGWRLHDIQYNTDSVLIVVSDDALVCVCSIAHYDPVFPNAAFCWLPTREV